MKLRLGEIWHNFYVCEISRPCKEFMHFVTMLVRIELQGLFASFIPEIGEILADKRVYSGDYEIQYGRRYVGILLSSFLRSSFYISPLFMFTGMWWSVVILPYAGSKHF